MVSFFFVHNYNSLMTGSSGWLLDQNVSCERDGWSTLKLTFTVREVLSSTAAICSSRALWLAQKSFVRHGRETVWECTCVQGRERLALAVFLSHSPLYSLRVAELCREQSPGIPLSPPPQSWDHSLFRWALEVLQVSGIKHTSSHWYSKQLLSYFPAPISLFKLLLQKIPMFTEIFWT